MSEYIKVTSAYNTDAVIDAVMERLIADGTLPVDFDFRALALPADERDTVVQQDLFAALGLGQPSGKDYLYGDLPDCAPIPPIAPMRSLLSKLDVDYHIVYDLNDLAHDSDISPRVPKSSWLQYIHHLDPKLYQNLIAARDHDGRVVPDKIEMDRRRVLFRMSRVAIRDSALLGIYHLPAGALPGHGPVARDLLHMLLLDNHPQLDDRRS